MKYDIFSFNNELDILDIRLNILSEHVDYFVIVEATETFSGVPKPLYYDLNKERYSKFKNKIIHYVVTDTPKNFEDINCDQEILEMARNSDNVTREHLCWLKEFYQKEVIKKALVGLNDEDICIVSDVDEIWNYDLDLNVCGNSIHKPMIDWCYIDYLNVRTSEDWTYFTGPIITQYSNIKNDCLNHLRTIRKMKDVYIYHENGGWHFNSLGGVEKKIQDFQHPVYTKSYMQSRQIGCRIDETDLPIYIINNKEKYKGLFKND
jgi:hypothetical protein